MEHKLLVHDNVRVAIADINTGEKTIGIVMDNNFRV